MAGVKGQRSGRKLSAEEHLMRGTFRPDRHGPREAAAAIPFPPAIVTAEIPADLLEGLAVSGRAFATALWGEFAFTSAAHRLLLRLAAQQVDRLAEASVGLAGGKLYADAKKQPIPNPWLKIEQRATRNLIDVLKAMDLERD